jgi:regulator of sigma E protease
MTILIFFIILAILVLVHELGHFLAAKKAGIRVDEFGFGFPPRLWGFKKGETFYSINWIPFGGFVKILGENAQMEGDEPLSEGDRGRTLVDKPKFVQSGVLAAGVFFNILLAWFILSLGLWIGLPTSSGGVPSGYELQKTQLIILDTVKDSPASLAGLKGGEIVTYISDGSKKISNPSVAEIQQFTAEHSNKKIELGILGGLAVNSSGERKVSITPVATPGGKSLIGISMDEIGILKLPFLDSIWQGLRLTILVSWSIIVALWGLVYGVFQGQTEVLSSVTGPIGLVGIIGSSLSLGFSYLLNLVAVISLNLAIINFLPFPALDGGRILILGIEAVIRKPWSPKFVNAANSIGFFILLALMAILTYRDVWHLISPV